MSARSFRNLHDDHVRLVPRLPATRGAVACGHDLGAGRDPRGTGGDVLPAHAPAR